VPIHNWKKAPPGLFHHFHQQWTGELCRKLNKGILPPDYFALIEQKAIGVELDVTTLKGFSGSSRPSDCGSSGGIALADVRPKVFDSTQAADQASYARKANRVTVRNAVGDLVAVIELVSPGNKHDKYAFQKFIEKAVEFLLQVVKLLIVDLFPPTRRDPQGIHKAIWDEIDFKRFKLPVREPLTVASYNGTPALVAFVEPLAVGDEIPEMPIFLDSERYVHAPLEATYNQAWGDCPAQMKPKIPT